MKKTIIISSLKMHGKHLPHLLGRKLQKKGIDVLLSRIAWPRDELFFYSDASFDKISKGTCCNNYSKSFVWNGGTYLKGDNFILSSATANPIEKRDETHKILGVKNSYYFDISEELDSLTSIKVSNKDCFFKSSFPHIDTIYNIGNTTKLLFTYNSFKLIQTAEKMQELTGYGLVTIPLIEAKYASIGFIEIDDKIVLDKRAKKTKKILEKIGYEVITTPFGLKKTNRSFGSLRCITQEIPFDLEKIIFMNPNNAKNTSQKIKLEYGLFFNLKGDVVLLDDNVGCYRIKLKY
jgi:hypothetical protein